MEASRVLSCSYVFSVFPTWRPVQNLIGVWISNPDGNGTFSIIRFPSIDSVLTQLVGNRSHHNHHHHHHHHHHRLRAVSFFSWGCDMRGANASGEAASREKRGRGEKKRFFPASPHFLLVSFPNLHNINSSASRGFQEQKPTIRSLGKVILIDTAPSCKHLNLVRLSWFP